MCKKIFFCFIALSLMCISLIGNAATVHTADFIPDGSRTEFNGFEGMPDTFTHPPTYTEDGITVDQVLGLGDDIWTTCGRCWQSSMDGDRSWYPSGADFGYTAITRSGGQDFGDVGFFVSSGFVLSFPDLFLYFELWNDGFIIQSGELPHGWEPAGTLYLGFSDDTFDEIRVRDSVDGGSTFGDGDPNALTIDSIEMISAIEVSIDIKFCRNPNKFKCKGNKDLPVTIFGSGELDVAEIDLSTLQLCLEDLSECTGSPVDWSMADRGDPNSDLGADRCAIGTQDGFDDLDAAFEASEVQAMLGDFCGGPKNGVSDALIITGSTIGGTPIFSVPLDDTGIDQLVKKNK